MLTPRLKQIKDYVAHTLSKKGMAPTEREIARRFKISPSTAHEHIEMLQERGYLEKIQKRARGIRILKSPSTLIRIPLLGTIAAGEPIHVFEEQKETIAVPQNKVPRQGEVYALQVIGNSMLDENIKDGDTILIKKQSIAENGEKVVALINGNEATLKTFYKERGHIRLQPANKNYQPIIIKRGQDFSLQGVLFDVIKTSETIQPLRTFVLPSKKDSQERGSVYDYLNKVYNGDIMHVLKDLPDNSVDMIFGDPDYNVGIKYNENNYTQKFEDYVNWYVELTKESMRVLKKDGNLFMMNYQKQNAHLRVKYLDSYFPHINEYAWVYNTNVGHTPRRFTTAHRRILHVRKSEDNKFFKDAVALPYKNPTDRRIQHNIANGSKGRMPYSWFEFHLVKNVSKEKTSHACQIPQKLTEMLIKASTNPKDIVFVLFVGSGAEIDVCRNFERQFISAEIDQKYCAIINDRLTKGYIDTKHRLIRGRRQEAFSKEVLSSSLG